MNVRFGSDISCLYAWQTTNNNNNEKKEEKKKKEYHKFDLFTSLGLSGWLEDCCSIKTNTVTICYYSY